jgi:hypothetical protein
MSVAFGVRQNNGVGTSDTDIRHMLKYKWSNRGIVGDGLKVSGANGLYYTVTEGMAICSKGSSDGFTEAYFMGGNTPTVSANSSGNPRIDVVWITAHDATQGDADNLVTLGVTQGTPATSPTEPAIPSYATKLGAFTMSAGATTTKGAAKYGSVDYAITTGASLGILMDKTNNENGRTFSSSTEWRNVVSGTIDLPTDRLLSIGITLTTGNEDGGYSGSNYCHLYIDGSLYRAFEYPIQAGRATSYFYVENLTLGAGRHTVSINLVSATCRWRTYAGGAWAGQRVCVTDLGLAK